APTELDAPFAPEKDCLFTFIRSTRWNMPPDQRLRLVEEHPTRLAVLVLHDFAAERSRRALVDRSDLDCSAVGYTGLAVGARQIDGSVGRNLVQIPASRKRRRRPVSLYPSAPGDPLARLRAVDSLFDFGEEVLE